MPPRGPVTDSRLQALRREARSSGDPHSQARLLVERLRSAESCPVCNGRGHTFEPDKPRIQAAAVGLNNNREAEQFRVAVDAGIYSKRETCNACAGFGSALRARIGLAAYAGSEPARVALGHEWSDGWRDAVGEKSIRPLQEFLAGLSRWSSQPFHAPVRAALAAAECARVVWEDGPARMSSQGHGTREEWFRDLEAPKRACDAVRFWLDDPTPRQLIALEHVHMETPLMAQGGATPWRYLTSFALGVGLRGPQFHDSSGRYSGRDPVNVLDTAARMAGEPAIRTAIQEALVSWSLS